MAPAGSYEALLAAARNGADAVYLGAKVLNARAGAGNFDKEELIRAADYLHERGKKLYVTVNTVVKQSELSILEDVAAQLHDCRADAAIVQDAGVCGALRQMLPGLHLHASTQMAICNAQGAQYLKARGFERAVLAREMDLEEIRACADTGIETEVFCHGALCVACSGQCLFSSMVGGRSGNRGQCAQPCRMEYTLSGAAHAKGYLLSPKDLCTAQILSLFEKANVTSLKIEGRLKRPEYVAIVTGIYRKLLDGETLTEAHMQALRQIFNRGGFTQGYAQGIRDGEFLSVRRPSHWGVPVARTVNAKRIAADTAIETADALVLRNDAGDEIPLKLRAQAGETVPNPTGKTGTVYRLVSQAQMDEARESFEKEKPCVRLNALCRLKVGKPAVFTINDGEREASALGETVQRANSGRADEARITEQLKKTGGTAYTIDQLTLELDGDAFLPVSALNKLRREAVEELTRLRLKAFSPAYGELHKLSCPESRTAKSKKPRLIVQSADIALLKQLLSQGVDEAVYEPDDIRDGALEKLDLSGLYLYLPPVLHSDTLALLNGFAKKQTGLKGVYVSNMAHLGMDWPGEIRYDFALNIANVPALNFLGIGEARYTPSVELTVAEIRQLGGAQELVAYGRLPLMRLRHCPLNAARGGGEHRACRACDSAKTGKRLNDTFFTDRMNVRFPLRRTASDEGCVINLMNSVPLNLSGRLGALPEAQGLRLLFTDETPQEAARILTDFQKALRGETVAPQGSYTTGHYYRITD